MFTGYLKINPIPVLLDFQDPALKFFVERDLLQKTTSLSKPSLCDLPECIRILKNQLENGSWKYKGKRPGDKLGENYELLETWRSLNTLVEKYGFDRSHTAVARAAEFIFSCQPDEGDIRGILSNQYMPYYMGAILEILIKAGYAYDQRVIRGLEWLLGMRQHDGGWIIPLMVHKMQLYYSLYDKPPIPPERELPFSHMATGMVIRAFAAHPDYRIRSDIRHVGILLKNRLFKKDVYSSRQSVDYWFKFQYPFWWTNLLTVLDSLAKLKFDRNDGDINRAIQWFLDNQSPDGLWHASYGPKDQANGWVTLAICRMVKHYL